MKKIAVLGAGGFAGRSLTEYFSRAGKALQVFPVTRKQVDLLDREAAGAYIKALRPDAVINCAAAGGSRKNGYNDGAETADVNFALFDNVESALEELPDTVHIIFGSGAQYDKSRPLMKVREDDIGSSVPKDPYGLGKLRIAKAVAARGRDKTFMPVIFGLFGPYEDYTYKFISNACVKVLTGMDIVINRNVRFDYLYIDDFCGIIEKLIDVIEKTGTLPRKIFNLTPTESVTIAELAEMVKRVSGKSPEIKILNEGLGPEYTGDNAFLMENIGYDYRFLTYPEAVTRLYGSLEAMLPSLDTESVMADAALKFCANKSSDTK